VFDWLTTVENATGRKAILYSYPSWFAGIGFTDARLAGYPLFIATYGTCASVPAPWTSAVFWQYSSTGAVPGVNADKPMTDVDRFFGTLDQLMMLTGVSPPDAGGADATPPDDASSGADLGGTPTGGCACSFASDRSTSFSFSFALAFAIAFAFRVSGGRRRARRAATRGSGSTSRPPAPTADRASAARCRWRA
jgi:lysozyme